MRQSSGPSLALLQNRIGVTALSQSQPVLQSELDRKDSQDPKAYRERQVDIPVRQVKLEFDELSERMEELYGIHTRQKKNHRTAKDEQVHKQGQPDLASHRKKSRHKVHRNMRSGSKQYARHQEYHPGHHHGRQIHDPVKTEPGKIACHRASGQRQYRERNDYDSERGDDLRDGIVDRGQSLLQCVHKLQLGRTGKRWYLPAANTHAAGNRP